VNTFKDLNIGLGDNSKEITDINLAYLLLAQRMIKEDCAMAMFRLGVSRELADMLGAMSLAQVVKLAASNTLICRFRLGDHMSMSAVVGGEKDKSLQQAHMSILMGGRQMQEATLA